MNGNVKSMQISGEYRMNFASASDLAFEYEYDKPNRLTKATNGEKLFEVANTYDKDGNILTLDRNGSTSDQIDHRNLITELKHRSMIIDDTVYLTKYYYDEAGSRIRKMTYAYIGSLAATEPPANSDVSNTNNWSIRNDEVYSRDISGRDLAIYKNNSILEYPFLRSRYGGKDKGR